MRRYNLFGIVYSATDYEEVSEIIVRKGVEHSSYGVSALAVHGLIEAYKDAKLRESINLIHAVVPDGQPVRWALNSFYNAGLTDRVYGPTLTLHVLRKANELKLRLFLYGSNYSTLQLFSTFINTHYAGIVICGIHVDRFREATPAEDAEDVQRIDESDAHIVLVGRGCPRQERWVADHVGKINAAMMAVGAAFDFHAGTVRQAPRWLQNRGLEWLFRLSQEPNRLWKRYLTTNSYFVYLFLLHKFILRRPN